MGQANHKLWDAVEEGDTRGLEEVLQHKEADVNHEKTFKAPCASSALFDVPYLSNTTNTAPLTKSPVATHEKIVNKMGLGENNNTDTITPLHAACERGNRDIVRVLLEHGAHPRAKAVHERWNENYDEHLIVVANETNISDIENCAYIKYAQYTPLYYACKNGHVDIVMELLLQPGEPMKRILEEASGGGAAGLVNNTQGDPASRYEQIWEAITQIVKMMVMYNADYAACLCNVVSRGDLLMMELLIKMGASVNGYDCDAIEKIVIDRKPALPSLYNPKFVPHERRPLSHAASKGDLEIVRLLLRYGAVITEPDIHVALEGTHNGVVELLLEYQQKQQRATTAPSPVPALRTSYDGAHHHHHQQQSQQSQHVPHENLPAPLQPVRTASSPTLPSSQFVFHPQPSAPPPQTPEKYILQQQEQKVLQRLLEQQQQLQQQQQIQQQLQQQKQHLQQQQQQLQQQLLNGNGSSHLLNESMRMGSMESNSPPLYPHMSRQQQPGQQQQQTQQQQQQNIPMEYHDDVYNKQPSSVLPDRPLLGDDDHHAIIIIHDQDKLDNNAHNNNNISNTDNISLLHDDHMMVQQTGHSGNPFGDVEDHIYHNDPPLAPVPAQPSQQQQSSSQVSLPELPHSFNPLQQPSPHYARSPYPHPQQQPQQQRSQYGASSGQGPYYGLRAPNNFGFYSQQQPPQQQPPQLPRYPQMMGQSPQRQPYPAGPRAPSPLPYSQQQPQQQPPQQQPPPYSGMPADGGEKESTYGQLIFAPPPQYSNNNAPPPPYPQQFYGQQHSPPQQQQQNAHMSTTATPATTATTSVDDSWEVDSSELTLEREIARGSFGIVYYSKFRGTEVAVKKLINQNLTADQMNEFMSEVNIMKKLHHPNVLLLMGVCTKPPNMCMVMEFMAGSLWDLLHKARDVRFDWKLIMSLVTGTAKGMNYLHLSKPPILHRDLKTPNLLVDKHFNVKICDFGLARLKASFMTGNLGTPQYMAPEIIKSENYTESADVYSFGIVMWEIVTRQPPFHGVQSMQIAYGVVHQGMRPRIPSTVPLPLSTLMQECWHQDARVRPTFNVILERLKAIQL